MNHDIQKKLAQEAELQQMQQKVDRMRELVSLNGFSKAYFALLKNSKTDVEAFNTLNEEYHELFGQYRYSSWDAFRNSMKHHNKK
jgi:DNA-binding GntR family transcriptional regulator